MIQTDLRIAGQHPRPAWRTTNVRTLLLIAAAVLIPSAAMAAQTSTRPRTSTYRVWDLASLPMGKDPVINVDVNNAPIREALKQIMEDAKQEYAIDADVPDDARVTVRARNVKLSTALDLVTQSAGVQ